MTRQISRDPFARTTLHRRTVPPTAAGCAWCGNLNRAGRLYEYGTEKDGIYTRPNWHHGLFCSKSCHDSYHG